MSLIRTFPITEGSNLDQTMTAQAASVVVSNPTVSWLSIAGALQPVPPGAVGVIIPLVPTSSAQAVWTAPTSIVPLPAGQGTTTLGVATLSYYTDAYPAAPGSGGLQTSAPQGLLAPVAGGTSPTPPSSGTNPFITQTGSGCYSVPLQLFTGCQSVMVVWRTLTTTPTQPSFLAVYDNSAAKLTWGSIGGTSAIADTNLIVPVSSLVDASIVVEVQEPAGVQHEVWVVGLPYPSAVNAALSGADAEIPVVTLAGTTLAVVQVVPPAGFPYIVNSSLASGASVSLAAAGTLTQGVYGGTISVDAVATVAVGVLSDAGGVHNYFVGSFQSNPSLCVPAQVLVGDGGLKFTNAGSATAFFRATFSAE